MIASAVVNTMNQSMANKATIFASSGQFKRSSSFINTLLKKNDGDDE